jgi:hypothetical protein
LVYLKVHKNMKNRGFRTQRGWHDRTNRADGRATQPRENTHEIRAHGRATLTRKVLIFRFCVFERKISIFDLFSISFSPMRPKLDHSSYTWKHGFLVQNNLKHHTPKWLISQKCLKRLLTQKPDFLPNDSSQKHIDWKLKFHSF